MAQTKKKLKKNKKICSYFLNVCINRIRCNQWLIESMPDTEVTPFKSTHSFFVQFFEFDLN